MRLGYLLAVVVAALAGCTGDDPPIDGDGCLSCHQGIEQAHVGIEPGACVVCHGGNPDTREKAAAHIAIPADWDQIRGSGLPPAPTGFIRDFAPDQLDALDPAYLQFINPGDIRVLDQTCGAVDCHPTKSKTMPNSVMSTNAGHYYPSLYLQDVISDRIATNASYNAVDPDCDPSIPGTVCEIGPLVPPDAEAIQDAINSGEIRQLEALATSHYLAKNCNTCHQAGFPRNNSPGLYRSAGCTACHMVYDKEGIYGGDDPTIPKGSPVHPFKHEITTNIPTEQCATCHFQGGRIGLLYQGIREGGFGTTPPNAKPINEVLYGHAPGFYIEDEDTTNQIDETPPDVHAQAAMVCADCHVGSDVHGDGRLYSSSKLQNDLRCEDCHGTIRERISPRSDGVFTSSTGRPLPQLESGATVSEVLLRGVDGVLHPVSQVADLMNKGNARLDLAMGEDESGWSHTDSLTCDTCHTSYNQFCIGCHVSFDLRIDQVDYQTGKKSPGLTRGSRTAYSLNNILLGIAPDGRVQSVQPSQQLQLAVISAERYGTEDGELLIGARKQDGERTRILGEFRKREFSIANNGFAPMFQHTSSKEPRGCNACHRIDDSAEEMARVRGVYGFGTGEFMLEAPDGRMIDGLQFLDEAGTPTTTWIHPGTGPLPPARLQRALDVIVGDLR